MAFFQATRDVETRLCTAVNVAIQARNADQLASIVLLEPPFPPDHVELIGSLQRNYPKSDATAKEKLGNLVRRVVTETAESEDEDGRPIQSWSAMVTFLVQWMSCLRDMDLDDLVDLFQMLSDIQVQANTALTHPTKGILMLPTILSYAKIFARVALGLDKQPDLIAHLLTESIDDEGRRESLPERAANIIRGAFITCLNDRNTVPGGIKDGRPDGKKIGVYKLANICLKILFQADKPESCQTVFKNITNSSPPIQIYPAAERVTYLYYLGRYNFAISRFYSAQLVLEQAYKDCHSAPRFLGQRRLILIYLVASNIMLGRFPTEEVYSVPEAKGFREAFIPVTQAIRRGDLEAFRRIFAFDLSHPSAELLFQYRVFYQMGNYCEVLVWRSLLRRIFLLSGMLGDGDQSAASLDLRAILRIFQFLEARAKIKNPAMAAEDLGPGRRNFGHIFQDHASTTKSTYIDPDFEGMDDIKPYDIEMDVMEIECICGSLITQGLVNGYISQKTEKLAISGARRPGGALRNGFPAPWKATRERNKEFVLGWKTDAEDFSGGVVHLSNVKAAGT